jgi:hypothetical protein
MVQWVANGSVECNDEWEICEQGACKYKSHKLDLTYTRPQWQPMMIQLNIPSVRSLLE